MLQLKIFYLELKSGTTFSYSYYDLLLRQWNDLITIIFFMSCFFTE
jgi:hypothetical protein